MVDENASPNVSPAAGTPRKRTKTPLMKSVKKAMKSLFTPSKNTSLPLMTLQDSTNLTKSAASSPSSDISLGITPRTFSNVGNTCCSNIAQQSKITDTSTTECTSPVTHQSASDPPALPSGDTWPEDSLQYSVSTVSCGTSPSPSTLSPPVEATTEPSPTSSPAVMVKSCPRRTSLMLSATYSSYYTPIYSSGTVSAILTALSQYKTTACSFTTEDIEHIVSSTASVTNEEATISRAELDTMIEKQFLAPITSSACIEKTNIEQMPQPSEIQFMECDTEPVTLSPNDQKTLPSTNECTPSVVTDEIASLKRQLQEAHTALLHSSTTISNLEEQLQDLQATSLPTSSLEKLYATITAELEAGYQGRLTALEQDLISTQKKLALAEAEVASIPTQIASVVSAAKAGVYEKVKQQFEDGNKKYSSVKQQLKETQNQLVDITHKAESQAVGMAALEEKLTTAQQEKQVVSDKCLMLEKGLRDISKRLNLHADEISSATVTAIIEIISSHTTTISTQQSAIANLSSDLATASKSLETCRQKADAHTEELANEKEKRIAMENEKEAQMQVLARLITSKG